MAVLRERPYPGFNFLVDLGGGTTDGPEAGFQEMSPAFALDVASKGDAVTGINRADSASVKRCSMFDRRSIANA